MTNPSGQGSRIKGLLRLTGMDGYAGVQAFVKIFLVVSSSPDFAMKTNTIGKKGKTDFDHPCIALKRK